MNPNHLKTRPNTYFDDNLIQKEFYNANHFPITFEILKDKVDYVLTSKGENNIHNITPTIICQPDSFVILPHSYYMPIFPKGMDGRDVLAHFNFGEDMGKGKKPSRETKRMALKDTGNKKIW